VTRRTTNVDKRCVHCRGVVDNRTARKGSVYCRIRNDVFWIHDDCRRKNKTIATFHLQIPGVT